MANDNILQKVQKAVTDLYLKANSSVETRTDRTDFILDKVTDVSAKIFSASTIPQKRGQEVFDEINTVLGSGNSVSLSKVEKLLVSIEGLINASKEELVTLTKVVSHKEIERESSSRRAKKSQNKIGSIQGFEQIANSFASDCVAQTVIDILSEMGLGKKDKAEKKKLSDFFKKAVMKVEKTKGVTQKELQKTLRTYEKAVKELSGWIEDNNESISGSELVRSLENSREKLNLDISVIPEKIRKRAKKVLDLAVEFQQKDIKEKKSAPSRTSVFDAVSAELSNLFRTYAPTYSALSRRDKKIYSELKKDFGENSKELEDFASKVLSKEKFESKTTQFINLHAFRIDNLPAVLYVDNSLQLMTIIKEALKPLEKRFPSVFGKSQMNVSASGELARAVTISKNINIDPNTDTITLFAKANVKDRYGIAFEHGINPSKKGRGKGKYSKYSNIKRWIEARKKRGVWDDSGWGKLKGSEDEKTRQQSYVIMRKINEQGLAPSRSRTYNNRIAPAGENIIKHQLSLAEKHIRTEIDKVAKEIEITQKFYYRKHKEASKKNSKDKNSLRDELYFMDRIVKQAKTATTALKTLNSSITKQRELLTNLDRKGLLKKNIDRAENRILRNIGKSLDVLKKSGKNILNKAKISNIKAIVNQYNKKGMTDKVGALGKILKIISKAK